MNRTILTRIRVTRFKLFEHADIELGQRVVFIGQNNAGKTSALQALALWDLGVKRWIEKRGTGPAPEQRPGVTINRRDLISLPIAKTNQLWLNLKTRKGRRENGKTQTQNIMFEILVEGITGENSWQCGFEFDYANEESFYCRPLKTAGDGRMPVPDHLEALKLAYLPPMSGLSASEVRLDDGAINVRIGEGRTAEVLRNLYYQIVERGDRETWKALRGDIERLFGVLLDEPTYIQGRGEITMSYSTPETDKAKLDLSASGRGMQQTMLVLGYLSANPGTVLLLDEPDAHLEILRQRQIYQTIAETADRSGGQVLMASHSEVILNEAADRDVVVAFVGQPHRIDDRGSQVRKALKEVGFEQYYQAKVTGWVLYLEGSTDLAILRTFAEKIGHPAASALERPFVHYVANLPSRAQSHFYALREAESDLRGIALYDRLESKLPEGAGLRQTMLRKREIENYLCSRGVLLGYAEDLGIEQGGEVYAAALRTLMDECIAAIESALSDLGKALPWGDDIKASDDVLTPVFRRFFKQLQLPNLIDKTDFHVLAKYVEADDVDAEIVAFLDEIDEVASKAAEAGA